VSRVFRKTALGAATFTKANSGLTQAQRGLLIMVDGKRSAGALRKFAASFGNVNILLRELFEAGLIELDPAYVEKIRIAQAEIAGESADLPSALVAETVVATARSMPGAASPQSSASAVSATPAASPAPAAPAAPARDIRHDLRNLGAPDPIGLSPSRSPNTITRPPLAGNTITRTPISGNTVARSPLAGNTQTRSPLNTPTAARYGPSTITPAGASPLARATVTGAPRQDGGALSLSLEPVDGSDDAPITSATDATLADARKFATHFVFDALGNSGTALCFAIERTETLKGLIETTDVAKKTLRNMKSDSIADDFGKQLREILLR
jgi:hypothetical protein